MTDRKPEDVLTDSVDEDPRHMIDAPSLSRDFQLLRGLEDDLRERTTEVADLEAVLRSKYDDARDAQRTRASKEMWRLTQSPASGSSAAPASAFSKTTSSAPQQALCELTELELESAALSHGHEFQCQRNSLPYERAGCQRTAKQAWRFGCDADLSRAPRSHTTHVLELLGLKKPVIPLGASGSKWYCPHRRKKPSRTHHPTKSRYAAPYQGRRPELRARNIHSANPVVLAGRVNSATRVSLAASMPLGYAFRVITILTTRAEPLCATRPCTNLRLAYQGVTVTTFRILVDLANQSGLRSRRAPNKPMVADRIDAVIDRAVSALTNTANKKRAFAEFRIRLYDAWFDRQNRGTQLYEIVRRVCSDRYPRRSRLGRIYVEIAECVVPIANKRFTYTLRNHVGLARYPVTTMTETPAGCVSPSNCTTATLRHWLRKKKCPKTTPRECMVKAEEICSFRQQKLVDTSIVADAVFLANEDHTVVIFSDDEDMIPGLVTAAMIGNAPVIWLSGQESPRPYYRSILAASGVEYVETRIST